MPRTMDGTGTVVADAAVWAKLPEAHAKTKATPSTRTVETGMRHPKVIGNLLQQSRTAAASPLTSVAREDAVARRGSLSRCPRTHACCNQTSPPRDRPPVRDRRLAAAVLQVPGEPVQDDLEA